MRNMLIHVDDVTPSSQRFVWLPHTTFDLLLRQNALSITVLEYYFRHAERYDPTLTKLLGEAGGQGKTQLSNANDVLYSNRFLARFEFGISIPTGEKGRPGQRYSRICASRVQMSDEKLAELIRQHTPGKYVVIPWGPPPQRGEPAEQRRVRIISCEVYTDGRSWKITACVCPDHANRAECELVECPTPHGDPLLADHKGRRGKRTGKEVPRPQPQRRPKAAPEAPSEHAKPEVENLTSGATSENSASAQVPPEVDQPNSGRSTSIKKDQPEDQEVDQARGAASGAEPAAASGAGPETSAAASVGGPPEPEFVGNHLTARGRDSSSPGLQWHGAGALSRRTDVAAQHELNRVKTSGRVPRLSWAEQQRRRKERDPAQVAAAQAELEQTRTQGPRRAPVPSPPSSGPGSGVIPPGAAPPTPQSRSRA